MAPLAILPYPASSSRRCFGWVLVAALGISMLINGMGAYFYTDFWSLHPLGAVAKAVGVF
jgi:hypothetical protein